MTEPIRATFRKPFAAQVAAFRLRLGNLVATRAWDDLRGAAHERAFVVAGAMKADLLADLAAAVDRAIVEGTGLEAFRRDFRAIVEKHGWHGWTGEGSARGEAWRTKVIYKTNMLTSMAAGRWAQLVDGGFKYLVYSHSGAPHPRLDHLSWDGLILPFEHPFWQTHAPPNGWGCGCKLRGAHTLRGAERLGGKPDKKPPEGWDRIDPRTGTPPGIGKGWDYPPGRSVAQTVGIAADKLQRHPALIGADFGAGLSSIIDRAWPVWVADVLAGGSHNPALAGTLDRALIRKLETMGRPPQSAEIMLRPGLISGPKARRHERKGDALSEEVWLSLPARLRSPQAVLLDRESGRLLYLLKSESERLPQLALALDYMLRVNRSARQANTIISAYETNAERIAQRLRDGSLILISGEAG